MLPNPLLTRDIEVLRWIDVPSRLTANVYAVSLCLTSSEHVYSHKDFRDGASCQNQHVQRQLTWAAFVGSIRILCPKMHKESSLQDSACYAPCCMRLITPVQVASFRRSDGCANADNRLAPKLDNVHQQSYTPTEITTPSYLHNRHAQCFVRLKTGYGNHILPEVSLSSVDIVQSQ